MQLAVDWGRYAPRGIDAVCIAVMQSRFPAAKLIRSVARRLLRGNGHPYDVVIDGLRIRCHPEDNATDRGLLTRGARQCAAGREQIMSGVVSGDVFIDVGANSGLYTLFAARRVGPAGRVLAIEPVPAMVERLLFNIEANRLASIVSLEACAVGEASGTAAIYVNERQHGKSGRTYAAGYTHHSVPMDTLLAICTRNGISRIDALKIDIEGHEDQALIPFLAAAPQSLWPKRILAEVRHCNRWQQDCRAALMGAGYGCAWFDRSDALFVRTDH